MSGRTPYLRKQKWAELFSVSNSCLDARKSACKRNVFGDCGHSNGRNNPHKFSYLGWVEANKLGRYSVRGRIHDRANTEPARLPLWIEMVMRRNDLRSLMVNWIE